MMDRNAQDSQINEHGGPSKTKELCLVRSPCGRPLVGGQEQRQVGEEERVREEVHELRCTPQLQQSPLNQLGVSQPWT